MATRGGLTTLFWSIAIITTATTSAGLLVLALLQSAPPPSPLEAMDENWVRFYVRCLRMGPLWDRQQFFKSPEEALDANVCDLSLNLIGSEYQSIGRISREYVEALRIIHDYNQTDVDIFICGLDHRRCPAQTKALNQFFTSRQMKEDPRLSEWNEWKDELRR